MPIRHPPNFITLKAAALCFIRMYLQDSGGVSPTYREIKAAIGIKSLGHMQLIMNALEADGRLVRLPNRARSIQILDGAPPAPPPAQKPNPADVLLPRPGKRPAAIIRACPNGRIS